MASSRDTELGRRRWTAGLWPSTPPPLPDLGHAGPVGLWEGGALVSYELAEGQGLLCDDRLTHPPALTGEGMFADDQQRLARWEREYRSQRGETYLQLGHIDLGSEEAILDFASTFGVLEIRALDAPQVARQWYAVAPPTSVPLRILRHYPGFGDERSDSAFDSSLREEVVERCQTERQAAPVWMISETITEFRWGARAVRDLRQAWTVLSSGEDPRQMDWENPRMPTLEMNEDLARSVTASFLEHTMSDALQGFSPRLWLLDDDGRRAFRGASSHPGRADPTLFELLILELFRHIAESASYKSCENEACGRMFVRQNDGAAHGKSRTRGVKYCTGLCSRAVQQRRYRQRQAAKKKGSG